MIPGAVLVVLGVLIVAVVLLVWLRSRAKPTGHPRSVQARAVTTAKPRNETGTSPSLPAADNWIGVNYTSPHQAVIGRRNRPVTVEPLLRKGSNPPHVHVHLGVKLVGELNTKNSAYLAPLISQLTPDARLVSVAGRVQGMDNNRTFGISIQVPSAPTVERLLTSE